MYKYKLQSVRVGKSFYFYKGIIQSEINREYNNESGFTSVNFLLICPDCKVAYKTHCVLAPDFELIPKYCPYCGKKLGREKNGNN